MILEKWASRTVPDFMIIGAQKCGTTSLYQWLTIHPDVVSARQKELHFFDRHDAPAPIDGYADGFANPRSLQLRELRRGRPVVTGEATPVYLFDPRVPEQVAAHLPAVRLIVILRDPAARALSHFRMSTA